MHLTSLGKAEVERRGEKLQQWSEPGTEVCIRTAAYGPASIESGYESALSVPPAAQLVMEASKDGFDAGIVGCFSGPGLDAHREITDMLVLAPGAVCIALATTLGHKFSMLATGPGRAPVFRKLAWEAGVSDALASVRSVDTPVLEFNRDRSASRARIAEQCRAAVEEDGADVVILGCMTMGFLEVAEELTEELGIPVINPSKTVLKFAEATLSLKLSHSRAAYHTPPKMAAGMSPDQLVLGEAT
jgi:allantoin racemase